MRHHIDQHSSSRGEVAFCSHQRNASTPFPRLSYGYAFHLAPITLLCKPWTGWARGELRTSRLHNRPRHGPKRRSTAIFTTMQLVTCVSGGLIGIALAEVTKNRHSALHALSRLYFASLSVYGGCHTARTIIPPCGSEHHGNSPHGSSRTGRRASLQGRFASCRAR